MAYLGLAVAFYFYAFFVEKEECYSWDRAATAEESSKITAYDVRDRIYVTERFQQAFVAGFWLSAFGSLACILVILSFYNHAIKFALVSHFSLATA